MPINVGDLELTLITNTKGVRTGNKDLLTMKKRIKAVVTEAEKLQRTLNRVKVPTSAQDAGGQRRRGGRGGSNRHNEAAKAADRRAKQEQNLQKIMLRSADIQTRTSSQQQAAMSKQRAAVSSVRQQYLNLRQQLERTGDADKQIRTLDRSFQKFQGTMRSGVLSTRDFTNAKTRMQERMGTVRRSFAASGGTTESFNNRMQELTKSVQIALGPLSGIAARITAFTALVNTGTAVLASFVAGLIAFGAAASRAVMSASRLESQMGKLSGVLQVTGQDARFTAEELNNMARELAQDTLAGATQARKAIGSLLTFGGATSGQFERMLRVAQTFADLGFGNLQSSARRLGRLLEAPLENMESLSRFGVEFTQETQAQITELSRLGKHTEAVNVILDRLESKTKGVSQAMAQGLSGAIDSLMETVQILFEDLGSVGGAIETVAANVRDLTGRLRRLIQRGESVQRMANGLNTIVGVLGGSLTFLVSNFDVLVSSLTGLVAAKTLTSVATGLSTIAASARTVAAAVGTATVATGAFMASAGSLVTLAGLAAGAIYAFTQRKDESRRSTELLNESNRAYNRIVRDGVHETEAAKEESIKKARARLEEAKANITYISSELDYQRSLQQSAEITGETDPDAGRGLFMEDLRKSLADNLDAIAQNQQALKELQNQGSEEPPVQGPDVLFEDYKNELESLQRQTAMVGKETERARIEYELEHGELKGLVDAQENLNEEKAREYRERVRNLRTQASELDQRQRMQEELDSQQSNRQQMIDGWREEIELMGTATQHQRVLAMIDAERFDRLEQHQRESLLAWARQIDMQKRFQKFNEEVLGEISSNIEDIVVNTSDWKDNWKDNLQDMGEEIMRLIFRMRILKPLMNSIANVDFAGLTPGPNTGSYSDTDFTIPTPFSSPGDVVNGGVRETDRFASGGIIRRPSVMRTMDGLAKAGESGSEAIMPVKRTNTGDLGVESTGGGGGNMFVEFYDQRNSDSPPIETQTEQRGDDEVMKVFVREQMKENLGNGSLDKDFAANTNVRRKPRRRA